MRIIWACGRILRTCAVAAMLYGVMVIAFWANAASLERGEVRPTMRLQFALSSATIAVSVVGMPPLLMRSMRPARPRTQDE